MRQVPHRHRVFIGELLARAHFFGHASEGERLKVIGKNNVGSNAGDHVAHIVVQAAPNRGDADDHGDANHNSQHGQRRAQLIAADGVRSHLHNLAEFVFVHHEKLVIGNL